MCIDKMSVNVSGNTFFTRSHDTYRHDEIYGPKRDDVRKAIDKVVRRWNMRPAGGMSDVLFFYYSDGTVGRLYYDLFDFTIDPSLGFNLAIGGRYALRYDENDGDPIEVTPSQAKMLVCKHFN